MEIKRVRIDEPAGLPCQILSRGSGWTTAAPPENGILVVLSDLEKQSGGILISEEKLNELGYVAR